MSAGDVRLGMMRAGVALLVAACGATEPPPPPPPAPHHLAFRIQPADLFVGSTLAPAVEVEIRDTTGALVSTATGAVSLALTASGVGATLTGTTVVNATGGVARFTDLKVDRPGLAFTLRATATGLGGTTSAPFRATLGTVKGGDHHFCGTNATGQSMCWGLNNDGRLGNGSLNNSAVPVPVSGGLTFTSVSPGTSASCALTAAGQAYCWGANHSRQLGNGTKTSSPVPVAVVGGHLFTALTSGQVYACGIATTGQGYCWGGIVSESRACPAVRRRRRSRVD